MIPVNEPARDQPWRERQAQRIEDERENIKGIQRMLDAEYATEQGVHPIVLANMGIEDYIHLFCNGCGITAPHLECYAGYECVVCREIHAPFDTADIQFVPDWAREESA